MSSEKKWGVWFLRRSESGALVDEYWCEDSGRGPRLFDSRETACAWAGPDPDFIPRPYPEGATAAPRSPVAGISDAALADVKHLGITGAALGQAAAKGIANAMSTGELRAEKLLREQGNAAAAKVLDAAAQFRTLRDCVNAAAAKVLDAAAQFRTLRDCVGSHSFEERWSEVRICCTRCDYAIDGKLLAVLGYRKRDPYATSALRDELGTAQRDLADARASEAEAQADAVLLRRRVAALEGQLAKLRRVPR